MDHQQLVEYIDHFLNQQKCCRHQDRRAKVMRIGTRLNEAYVCSECMELDNNQIQYISVKRAEEQIRNFIMYDHVNHKTLLDSSLEQIIHFKQQLTSFYQGFNSLLVDIETKLKLRQEMCEKYKSNYEKKLFDLQKCVNNYNKMEKLKTVDVNRLREEQSFSTTLNHFLFVLLQNEQLITTCSHDKQQKINDIFKNSTNLVTNLVAEQYAQLQSLINQEDYLMSLISDQVEPKNKLTSTMFDTYQSTKSQHFNTVISSYSSQMVSNLGSVWFIRPEHSHKSFELKESTNLHVPYDHTLKNIQSHILRLAIITPGIQEGPLKQPRSITFQIDQQIKQILLLGICNISQKDCELNLSDENRNYIFFSSQGHVITREQQLQGSVIPSPQFARGDTISMILKPQTNYIQIVKNKQFNQPFQLELPGQKAWQWLSLNFCIGVQGSGGVDIQIMN